MRSIEKTLLAVHGFSDPDRKTTDHSLACRYLATEAAEKIVRRLFEAEISAFERYHAGHKASLEGRCLSSPEARSELAGLVKQGLIDPARSDAKYLDRPTAYILVRGFAIKNCHAPRIVTLDMKVNPGAIALTCTGESEVPIIRQRFRSQSLVGWVDVRINARLWYPCERVYGTFRFGDTPEAVDNTLKISLEERRTGGCVESILKDHSESNDHDRIGDIAIEVKIGKVDIESIIQQMRLYMAAGNALRWLLVTPWGINDTEEKALTQANIRHLQLGESFEQYKARVSQAAPVASATI